MKVNNENKMYFPLIQPLRFIAFLMILCDHSKILKILGEYGVEIFLVLSGFLLQYRYQKKNVDIDIKDSAKFSLKKIMKLYPLHIFTLILSIILEIYLKSGGQILEYLHQNIKRIFMNVFLIQIWSIDKEIYFSYNGVVWYLSLMLFIYTLFPLLFKIVRKMTIRKIFFCIIIEIMVSIFVNINPLNWSLEFIDWFTYVFLFYRMIDFLAGMCLGAILLNNEATAKLSMANDDVRFEMIIFMFVIFVNIIMCALGNHCFYVENHKYVGCTLFLVVVMPLIWIFAKENKIAKTLFGHRFLIFLGDRSMYYFLIHNILLGYIRTIVNKVNMSYNQPIIMFISSLIGTIIFTEIYLLVTKNENRIRIDKIQ